MFFKVLKNHLSTFARVAPMTHVFLNQSSSDHNGRLNGNLKKRDVFLLSNSLLYALNDQTVKPSEKLPPYVIVAPFWLDKAHADFDDNDWGQSIVGFPSAFRDVFLKIHPHFPKDKFLSWKQVKETRESQMTHLHALHKKGVIVLFDYRHKDIATYEAGKLFKMTNQKGTIQFFVNDSDGLAFSCPLEEIDLVFNYLSTPRQLPEVVTAAGFKTRPQTDLYFHAIADAPSKILVHGSGLSVVWLAKHFPSTLVCSIQKDDRPLPRIPSNSDVNYDQIKVITLGSLSVDQQQSNVVFATVKDLPHPLPFNLSTEVFTSIGYVPYTTLTACLPPQKIKSYTDFDADKISWTAPINIPLGSLTHRLLGFFYQAEIYNLISEAPYELQYYIGNTTPLVLQNKLNARGVAIDEVFFNALESAIKALDNPLSEKNAELEFYCDIFTKKNDDPPSEEEKKIFRQVIMEMQQEVEIRLQQQSSYFSAANDLKGKPKIEDPALPGSLDEGPRFKR